MRFRAWLEKAKYKTWFGELCGNTFSLILSLAFISFLNVATEGTIMAIAATSFWFSWKARWNPFRSGFLPALVSSSVLQLVYFVSGADIMPFNIMVTMFVGNLILISVLAAIFSGLGTWLRNRKIRKTDQEKKDVEEKKSVFSDNLKRLAIITLFFYIQMFVIVPLAAKVYAESTGTQISSDEFIENYDPENTYTTKSKIPDVKPKRRVPLESPYGNITGAELEQLEAYCQTNGCDLTIVASQLSQMRLKGIVSMDNYMALLDQTYAPKPVVQWQNTLLIPKVVKSLKNNAKGKKAVPVKVAKKKVDNRPWYQKAWDGAKRFGEELDNKMIHEPTKFIKEHPWQAAGMAVVGIGLVAAAIVSAPVAAVLGVAAVVMAGASIYGLGKAYDQGGWNGVANNVFSKPTIAMWNSGDKGGAAGRGVVELVGKALEIIPVAEAPKAAVTVVKGLETGFKVAKAIPTAVVNTAKTINAIGEIRVTIAIVDDTGLLNSGGVKVLKNLAKTAGDHLDAINPFVKNLPNNPGALAVVNNSGKEVVAAGKVGASESLVAEKKAGEIMGKIDTIKIVNQPFKIDIKTLPQTRKSAVAKGTLPRPSKNTNLTFEDLERIEIANKPRAHGIERHVEKSNDYLESRGITNASTFNNKQSYVEHVNKTLSRDSNKINDWLNDPTKSRLQLDDLQDDKVIGRITKSGANHTGLGTTSRIILQKNNSGGYYILTNPVLP